MFTGYFGLQLEKRRGSVASSFFKLQTKLTVSTSFVKLVIWFSVILIWKKKYYQRMLRDFGSGPKEPWLLNVKPFPIYIEGYHMSFMSSISILYQLISLKIVNLFETLNSYNSFALNRRFALENRFGKLDPICSFLWIGQWLKPNTWHQMTAEVFCCHFNSKWEKTRLLSSSLSELKWQKKSSADIICLVFGG